METLKLNRCPRCGGYMFLDKDDDSVYLQCLQCSYQYSLEHTTRLKLNPVDRRLKTKV